MMLGGRSDSAQLKAKTLGGIMMMQLNVMGDLVGEDNNRDDTSNALFILLTFPTTYH